MENRKLSDTLGKLETYVAQTKGSLGNQRAVVVLNDLMAIQGYVQTNARDIKEYTQVIMHLDKVKQLLGMTQSG